MCFPYSSREHVKQLRGQYFIGNDYMVTSLYYEKIFAHGKLERTKVEERINLNRLLPFNSRASKLKMRDKARCCANRFVIENERAVGCEIREIREIRFASIMGKTRDACARTCQRENLRREFSRAVATLSLSYETPLKHVECGRM